jgi:hypothetical protein
LKGPENLYHSHGFFSAIEIDTMHTGLPNHVNNWQNHLKIATGLIYHF